MRDTCAFQFSSAGEGRQGSALSAEQPFGVALAFSWGRPAAEQPFGVGSAATVPAGDLHLAYTLFRDLVGLVADLARARPASEVRPCVCHCEAVGAASTDGCAALERLVERQLGARPAQVNYQFSLTLYFSFGVAIFLFGVVCGFVLCRKLAVRGRPISVDAAPPTAAQPRGKFGGKGVLTLG